jgi:hypothetical protein
VRTYPIVIAAVGGFLLLLAVRIAVTLRSLPLRVVAPPTGAAGPAAPAQVGPPPKPAEEAPPELPRHPMLAPPRNTA